MKSLIEKAVNEYKILERDAQELESTAERLRALSKTLEACEVDLQDMEFARKAGQKLHGILKVLRSVYDGIRQDLQWTKENKMTLDTFFENLEYPAGLGGYLKYFKEALEELEGLKKNID